MGVGKKHYLDISIATVHPAGLASSDKDPDCCLDRTEMSYISRAFDAGVPLVNLIPPVSSQLNLQVDDLEDLGLPAGIYLVHGTHDNSPIISKIHLNR
jgi:hypothetical protein